MSDLVINKGTSFRNKDLIIPESMAQDFGFIGVLGKQAHSRLRNCFSSTSVESKDKSYSGIIESSFLTTIKTITLISIFILSFSSILNAETRNKGKAISNAWELPPLILNDLEGQKRNLYDWHGKIIMLNFWATWCGPCQIEIPDFIEYQKRYAAQGLQIIGVGLDEVRKLRNYVRTVGINYPILQADPEAQYSLLNQWGNSFGVLPFTVIIARDGHFVFMQQGILSKETFDLRVKPLLTPH